MPSDLVKGAMVAGLLASACGIPGAPSPSLDPLAGQYSASGGGGALAHVQALTKRFSELHPGVVWLLEDVGSDASVKLVAAGDVDLGFTSRELRDSEKDQVQTIPIGAVGTSVAVNAANPVTGLTTEQVRKIFTGEIADWAEVGGNPAPIRLFIREKNASTRDSFEGFFFKDAKPAYPKEAIEVLGLEETAKGLGSFKDAIGAITLDDRTLGNKSLRLLNIDGVAATKENLFSGVYKVRRPLFIIHRPEAASLKPGARAFLDFVRSAEGQAIAAGM